MGPLVLCGSPWNLDSHCFEVRASNHGRLLGLYQSSVILSRDQLSCWLPKGTAPQGGMGTGLGRSGSYKRGFQENQVQGTARKNGRAVVEWPPKPR